MEQLLVETTFYEIAALLVLAATLGFLGVLLRQPLIVSFIAVGVIAGPSVLDIARSVEHIDLLSELGIAILLFLVGIKLDLKLVRALGPVALLTGLGQIAFTSVVGVAVALGLGYDAVTAIYIAVALTFSSTIIIVKLLSDKGEIDSLHGRIALGFLIVQDIVVVLAMIVLSAVGIGAVDDADPSEIARVFLGSLIMLAAVLLFIRYAADPLAERLARTPELLLYVGVALTAMMAGVGDYLGVGMELGGLLAGVSLASTRYRDAIAARLAPLRDFLILFFFVGLGSQLALDALAEVWRPALIFALIVLVGNPLSVMAIMGAMGYRKRTGFLAGLTVAQIGEFSLIFMAMGVGLGHIGSDALAVITLVAFMTIAASTYMVTFSHRLYPLVEHRLGILERRGTPREAADASTIERRHDTIVCGLGRYGGALARRLIERGYRVLGVDFNPSAVRQWQARGLDAVYGDITDPDFVARLPLDTVDRIVSAVPGHDVGPTGADSRLVLIELLRERRYEGRIVVAAHGPGDDERLRNAGADLVLEPFQDAADRAAVLIAEGALPRRLDPEEEEQRDIAS